LAGFLWLVPASLLKAFPNKIINIHPALLPKYGGKGMYGDHIHKAVLAASEEESGITIHFANESLTRARYCTNQNSGLILVIRSRLLNLRFSSWSITISQG
jgi:folate-dependent phosphoribosylglycinamide formyltransferase PurN